jgi:hypothetical protein
MHSAHARNGCAPAVALVTGLALAACASGAPRNNFVAVSSLGPFPAAFLEPPRAGINDPVLLNMECTVGGTDTVDAAMPQPTLSGRLGTPGSSLTFIIRFDRAPNCSAPRLQSAASVGIARLEITTSARQLVVGADSGIIGKVTLTDGAEYNIDPAAPSRLRLTRGDPNHIEDGLVGEFEIFAREANPPPNSRPSAFVVSKSSKSTTSRYLKTRK